MMVWCAFKDTGEPCDWFPAGPFRPNCERTYFDPLTGLDESLFEMMERSERGPYKLMELTKVLELKKKFNNNLKDYGPGSSSGN